MILIFMQFQVHLAKTLFHNKGEIIFQTPKTKESKRLISLDTKTLSLIKKWPISQKETNLAVLILVTIISWFSLG
jgi:hypothetical protein